MRISDWSSDVCSSDLCASQTPARSDRYKPRDAFPTGVRRTSCYRPSAGRARMKPVLEPVLAVAVLVSLPWLAQATPQDTAKRQPTASFSTPDKPVEGRMVLRDATSDALDTQNQGLPPARPEVRWPPLRRPPPPPGPHRTA